MRAVYRPLFLNESPLLFTSRRSSELIKYAANAFLATKITFINEMADLCEKLGANVQDVSRGIGLDNRIGSKFLHAGPGYGGSCFPKDTLALLKTAQDHETPVRVVEAVVQANDLRKRAMGRKIITALGGDVRGLKIGLLGLTIKPNTDDMRDAPSIAIVQTLLDAGAIVHAHDPEGMEEAAKILPDVNMADSAYDAAQGAHAVALVTEWDAYRALDLKKLHAAMAAMSLWICATSTAPRTQPPLGLTMSAWGANFNSQRLQFTCRSKPAQYGARRSLRRILPDALRGKAAIMSTERGTLKPAMRSRAQPMTLSGSMCAPGLGTHTAFTASPHLASGTPITATSNISGCP
jgi:UDPglucose 6-dehydrogenase